MYLLDGAGPYPDPCSRFQPQGVHGPSSVVDPAAFEWSDRDWRGVPLERAVIYELHAGTFTPAGTFAGVTERLPDLADLGVTVVELMPVADFPGSRNWGYDGVSLFAPSRQYGTPDDLRRLVDAAHGLGLAVLLDVVYNHFGPDGAYSTVFSPFYRSSRHQSPWGAAINFDGEQSGPVRAFCIENALHWVKDVILGEDDYATRAGYAPQNAALLRSLMITLFRLAGFGSITAALRWFTHDVPALCRLLE